MTDCSPYLAESDFVHKVAVDQLKWQLGQPVPYWLPTPLCSPRFYGYSWYDYPYCYPWAGPAVGSQYLYSMGFRDGLQKAGTGAGVRSSGATPVSSSPYSSSSCAAAAAAACAPRRCESPAAAAAQQSGGGGKKQQDLMEFPSGSYRRSLPVCPVSTDTSHDLPLGWPYGCKPFYFRHADPPSVRYY